jgi:hypothetical protein
MEKITTEEITMMAEDLFGGEATCSHKIHDNGAEEVVVQSFDKIDGVYEETHFARFDSIVGAYKHYEHNLSARNSKMKVGKGGNFKISMDTDGTYFLDGYENNPVADVLDKPELIEDTLVQLESYSTRHDFTNENGKIYINLRVSVPVDVFAIRNKDVAEAVINKTREKFGDSISLFKYKAGNVLNAIETIKNYIYAIGSKIKTDAKTNIDIFEVFVGGKKLNRL